MQTQDIAILGLIYLIYPNPNLPRQSMPFTDHPLPGPGSGFSSDFGYGSDKHGKGKEDENGKSGTGLVGKVGLVILRECLDPSEDLMLSELEEEIMSFQPFEESARLCRNLKDVIDVLQNPWHIEEFFKNMNSLLNRKDDEHTIVSSFVIERKSPIGQFIRRCCLSFSKLTFEGVSKLQWQIARWQAQGMGSSWETDENIAQASSFEVKSLDDTLEARTKAFASYQSSIASGDYTKALNALNTFFGHQFPRQNRGLHQHVLLNLASFHSSAEEYPAARRYLEESIKISRSAGDKSCLASCMSLLRKLNVSQSTLELGQIPQIQLEPEDFEKLSAMDQLWELRYHISLGEPVTEIYHKLYRSKARSIVETHPSTSTSTSNPISTDSTDPNSSSSNINGDDSSSVIPALVDLYTWDSTERLLWSLLGEETLSVLREDLVLQDPSGGRSVDDRLSCICSRAIRIARAGQTDCSLSWLFDGKRSIPSAMATLETYKVWARTVFEVLDLEATRKGQERVRRLISKMAGGDRSDSKKVEGDTNLGVGMEGNNKWGWVEERLAIGSGGERIERLVKQAREMKTTCQPTSTLPPLLQALEIARSQNLHGLHRLLIVLLADVHIDLDEPRRGLELIDEVFPKILITSDKELQAYAFLTRARCLITSYFLPVSSPSRSLASPSPDILDHLSSASQIYQTINAYSFALETLQLQAVFLDRLGQEIERDEVSESFCRVKAEWESFREGEGLERDLKRVKKVAAAVGQVSVAIAGRSGR
ncbi:APC5 [Phaffia rhodozyma]|uniref:Anaphase-promoting complex subunit 5 n=1 Tax=Phaffia rhodozyma TaxID=264483 RepID=A0A0F7SPU8_PHARH|nr:APC5 [Phaffia rhodozyma]